MIGTWFLAIVSSGSIVLLIGTFNLPERWSWRGITLIVWGLIGLTSPAFGWLLLFPWLLLALSLPLIVVILVRFFRTTRTS